jgi:hypothetical protein
VSAAPLRLDERPSGWLAAGSPCHTHATPDGTTRQITVTGGH